MFLYDEDTKSVKYKTLREKYLTRGFDNKQTNKFVISYLTRVT